MTAKLKIAPTPVERAPSVDTKYDEIAILRKAEAMRADVTADLLRQLGRAIRAAFGRIAQSMRDARAMQELSKLDDRTLADIGISRGDIPRVVLGIRDDAPGAPQPANEPHEPRRAA